METESQSSRKRTKNNGDGADNLASHAQPIITPAMKVQNEKDHTVRQALSADADMWQDGTGHGVADAFAAVPPSSPAASSINEKMVAPESVLLSTTMQRHYTQERIGVQDNVDKTPPESISKPGATSTRHKGILITPIQREAPQTLEQISMAAKDIPTTISYMSHPVTPSKDLGTPTKLSPRSASSPVTPTNKDDAPSQQSSGGLVITSSMLISSPRPASSSKRRELKPIGNNNNTASNFYSESSGDFGTRRPVFRFERRAAADGGEAEAENVPTQTVEE